MDLARRHTWTDIERWIAKSSRILIKKLARNDYAWADGPKHGHQNGTYIPREIREAGFFPPLENSNPAKPHIFDTRFETFCPETGEIISEEHTSELQSLMRNTYAVFCLQQKMI